MNPFDLFAVIERYHSFQNPTSEAKLDLVMEYCEIRNGMRILDVGSGKGWLLRRLARRFDVRITGLEISHIFADEARRLIVEENLQDRITIVEGPAQTFRAVAESFDIVTCIGASFALGDKGSGLSNYENALDWMRRYARQGGSIVIGEVFANVHPLPDSLPRNRDYDVPLLWTLVEKMRQRDLYLRGLVESSLDDWNHYHSLQWQAAIDWALENPKSDEVAQLLDPARQRLEIEADGRLINWAVLVARNGLPHRELKCLG